MHDSLDNGKRKTSGAVKIGVGYLKLQLFKRETATGIGKKRGPSLEDRGEREKTERKRKHWTWGQTT